MSDQGAVGNEPKVLLQELAALGQRAADEISLALGHSVVTFRMSDESRSPWDPPYEVLAEQGVVRFFGAAVRYWLESLPQAAAVAGFEGLSLRAAAAFHLGAQEPEWSEARAQAIVDEEPEYGPAFESAHTILEGHRLDELVLEHLPHRFSELEAAVRLDLLALPDFDELPRGALLASRPCVPHEVTGLATRAFIETARVDNWRRVADIVAEYVRLSWAQVDEMADLTGALVELVFPEAVGLTYGSGEDSWDLKAQLSRGSTWEDVASVVAHAMKHSEGHAGLDYGDALAIHQGDIGMSPGVAIWAAGEGEVSVDLVKIPGCEEWQQSHVLPGDAERASYDLASVLRLASESPQGYWIRARGSAADFARRVLRFEVDG